MTAHPTLQALQGEGEAGNACGPAAPAEPDRDTLVKVARSLAHEATLDSLLETLIGIGVEHARAERGLLVLAVEEGWQVAVQGHLGAGGVKVVRGPRPLRPSDMPPGVLDRVARTRSHVLVDGTSADDAFGCGPHAQSPAPRSLLCLPLVRQSSLTGLLYFDNAFAPGAFEPQRRALLEVIAALAASALENARVQAALRDSEQRFRSMADANPDVVWITELSPERVVYTSPSFERIWGLRVEDLYRDPHLWIDSIHPEDRPRIMQAFGQWLAGDPQTPWEAQFRVLRPDGGLRWIRERGVVIHGGKRVSGVSTDITQQWLADAALRESETRYALAMAAARDGHWDWVVATDEYYASPRMLEIYGFPPDTRFNGREDFLARFPFHPEDRAVWNEAATAHFAGRTARFEIEFRMLRHGQVRWIHLSGLLSRDGEGQPVRWTGSVSDVSDRKASEAALRESEGRFALAVQASNDGIWDLDVVAGTMFMSERAQRLHGLEPGATVRRRGEWVRAIIFHPEDAAQRAALIEAYLDGDAPSYDGEWRVQHTDGAWRWVHIRGLCLRDAQGRATRMAGSISDIDARRRAEAALQQSHRLEAVGTLAGGIAHDFNNILGAILGFGDMALRHTRAGSLCRRDLEQIIIAGERGRAIVERVLAFSRTGVGERVAVNVQQVVREGLELLAGALPARVRVEPALDAAGAAVLGDSTQVHQLLMNLSTNAIQAMPQGGTLRVSLTRTRLARPLAATTDTLGPGEYVLMTVSDTGTGIAPEIAGRIFDPFFTTKEVGAGTGLGLSLVHGIVTEFGGAVNVVSVVGQGSTFSVYLPCHGDVPAPVVDRLPAVSRGAHEQVLVVDDEEALARLLAQTLSGLGYVPVVFGSAEEALTAFTAHPERFDAVVTDERMPGLSGSELIRAMRGVRATVPALLVSGYLGSAVVERAREAGADAVLRKPLARAELAQALARAIAAHAGPTPAPPSASASASASGARRRPRRARTS
jgi:PAS domain S-box-containing protein